jgi:hypothetical protein
MLKYKGGFIMVMVCISLFNFKFIIVQNLYDWFITFIYYFKLFVYNNEE